MNPLISSTGRCIAQQFRKIMTYKPQLNMHKTIFFPLFTKRIVMKRVEPVYSCLVHFLVLSIKTLKSNAQSHFVPKAKEETLLYHLTGNRELWWPKNLGFE